MIIYQTLRKLHLWLGLILASILLMEAITGLILTEPGLIGQEKSPMHAGRPVADMIQGITPEGKDLPTPAQDQAQARATRPVNSAALGIVKGLHQGKIGNLDLKWIIDLAAIGLILLTLTGIYISIPLLKARTKKNNY